MICLKCDSEEFVLKADAQIEQVFRGETLKVVSPAMACSKCGWLALSSGQTDELLARTKAAYNGRMIENRLAASNEFLQFIAGCGQKFFECEGKVSQLSRENDQIWWNDSWEGHRTRLQGHWNDWADKIRHGAGVRTFIEALRDFVPTGKPIGPYLFQHWGYRSDTVGVSQEGIRLGIVDNPGS